MAEQKHIKVSDKITVSNSLPFVLISGPCVIESKDVVMKIAEEMVKITDELGIPYIFKASFDKANRMNINSFRGVGLDEGLKILQDVKDTFGCHILTDVHTPEQAEPVAEVVDVMQTPAFLARQTDFLVSVGKAAKKYDRAVNIKRGQFMAPWDLIHTVGKLEHGGCDKIFICERGTNFGYNRWVVDPIALPEMARFGYPVVIDATHSIQTPGGKGNRSGGLPHYAPIVARSAVANGVGAVFLETHSNVDEAKSDGPNMIPLDKMKGVLIDLKAIDEVAKKHSYFLD
jgi:2-dehydro-3-deoxyphosphooctonate aldolase (KDO 8-P synthase)